MARLNKKPKVTQMVNGIARTQIQVSIQLQRFLQYSLLPFSFILLFFQNMFTEYHQGEGFWS